MIIKLKEVVLDRKMRGLCAYPYPNHKKGCPNFRKLERCPPGCPLFSDKFDMAGPFYAIINEFDLAAHVARMKAKHPAWSQRQLECVLYWQGTARKQLHKRVLRFLKKHPELSIEDHPEAGAVNVTETLQRVGINLEWPPKNIVRQVAIAAPRRRS